MRKGLEGQGGRRSKVGDKVIETPAEKTKAEGKGIAKSIPNLQDHRLALQLKKWIKVVV
ncbi:hypothetical protein AMTR_s00588p00009830, partial [Amborella trichopoda]